LWQGSGDRINSGDNPALINSASTNGRNPEKKQVIVSKLSKNNLRGRKGIFNVSV
jgi:hypothetical protein